MVVLSIQICNGLKVLKNWGLHPVNEIATIVEVFIQLAQQQMDGCSNFVFPEDLRQCDCYTATMSCELFQTFFSSARVGEVLLYDK